MAARDDIHGEPIAPKSTRDFLLRVGGKNVLGEPMYRAVHSTTRYMKQGGLWKKWARGATIQERGGMVLDETSGLMLPSHLRPESTVLEVKEVLKYAHLEGWVLERWCPAYMYGSQENWNRYVVPLTEVPLLGPYPADGDYEFASGPSKAIPEISRLRDVVSDVENNRANHWETVESEVRQRVNDAQFAYEEQQRKLKEEDQAFFRDQLSPWNHMSLSAGRWREDLARRAGVKEHAGN